MPFKNKTDRKTWYKASNETVNRKKRQSASRTNKRALLAKIKDVPCMDCQIKYPTYVMDFDHVRGKKVFNFGKAVDDNVSVEKLMVEVDKCDVVCSNCHRERTYQRSL